MVLTISGKRALEGRWDETSECLKHDAGGGWQMCNRLNLYYHPGTGEFRLINNEQVAWRRGE